MTTIRYGSPEPARSTQLESPDGTWWYYDEEERGWVSNPGGSPRDWDDDFDESDFPMTEVAG